MVKYFFSQQRFLSTNHKYKKNRKDFFIVIVERDVVLPIPLGEELYDVVSQYEGIISCFQSAKYKFYGFGVTHNFIKQSIF
jgi:hypothetical protein